MEIDNIIKGYTLFLLLCETRMGLASYFKGYHHLRNRLMKAAYEGIEQNNLEGKNRFQLVRV